MINEAPCSREQISDFVTLLKNDLPNQRSRSHILELIIFAFVLASLIRRQKLAGVHRLILNCAGRLFKLTQTLRWHWGTEFNNGLCDLTVNEDNIKTRAGNQAQVMGLLCELIWQPLPKNFQTVIEIFAGSVLTLEPMPGQVEFL